jgi:hypothetical protein
MTSPDSVVLDDGVGWSSIQRRRWSRIVIPVRIADAMAVTFTHDLSSSEMRISCWETSDGCPLPIRAG